MTFKLTNTRLFTFGCSFTQYIWPTWADILSKNFNFVENWGLAGSGNLYIFNSIIEANKRHKFTSDDTIVIVWSGLTRIDYYNINSWQPQGGDFEFKNNDMYGYEVINHAYIDCIKLLLDSLNLNYKMLCLNRYPKSGPAYTLYKDTLDSLMLFPYKLSNKKIALDLLDLKKTYYYDLIKNTYNRNAGFDWPQFDDYFTDPDKVKNLEIKKEIENCIENFLKGYHIFKKTAELIDYHPTPKEHLKAVINTFPDYQLTPSIEDWVSEFNKIVLNSKIIPFSTNTPKNRL